MGRAAANSFESAARCVAVRIHSPLSLYIDPPILAQVNYEYHIVRTAHPYD